MRSLPPAPTTKLLGDRATRPARQWSSFLAMVALVLSAVAIDTVSPSAAEAGGGPVLTMPEDRTIAPSTSAVPLAADPAAFQISGYGAITLLVNVSLTGASGTTFQLPTPADGSSLALSYGYASWGGREVSFTGTPDDVNGALAGLTVTTGSATGTGSLAVTVTENESGTFYYPGTKHFYRYVAQSGVTVGGARTAAEASTLKGQSGYLVTITSAGEQAFVNSKIENANNIWIGATDAGHEGQWKWMGGPEADVEFWRAACVDAGGCPTTNYTGGTAVEGRYSNWCSGEPNNSDSSRGGEHHAVTNWSGGTCWNDLNGNNTGQIGGYVVEYGDGSGDATVFSGVYAGVTEIRVATVPEAPTGITVTAGDGSAEVSWVWGDAKGADLIDATVTASPGGATCTADASETSCTVSGLTPGESYTFVVTARNELGVSASSVASEPVTILGTPPAPGPSPAPAPAPASDPVVVPVTVPAKGAAVDAPLVIEVPTYGVVIRFEGVTATGASPELTLTPIVPDGPGGDRSDRGVTAVGTRFDLQVSDLSFTRVEVCVPFDRHAVGASAEERIHLVHTHDGQESDITVSVRLTGDLAMACGVTDRFSDFHVVVLRPDRVAGADRYATAAQVARRAFPAGATTVYVASGQRYADALVAGALAATEQFPLLLVTETGAPSATISELQRLSPDRIVLVGGEHAVSEEVSAQLTAAVPTAVVDRIAGTDRYGTSVSAALSMAPAGGTVLLATGASFPDALVAGAEAARTGASLMLVRPDRLDASVAAALESLAPTQVIVIGGPAAVSEEVVDQVRAVVPGAVVDRVAGLDRYATAVAVAARSDADGAVVATGLAFADALTATPLAVAGQMPVVLVRGDRVPPPTLEFLEGMEPERLVVIGGERAIDANTMLTMARTMTLASVQAI